MIVTNGAIHSWKSQWCDTQLEITCTGRIIFLSSRCSGAFDLLHNGDKLEYNDLTRQCLPSSSAIY